jgi:hypothetical protein
MGQSYGAQAALAWVAEADPAVGAVVSLDTTLEYTPLDQEEVRVEGGVRWNASLRDVRTRFEKAPHLSIPILIFTQARMNPGFALYEKLPHATCYYAQVKHVHHGHFVSLSAATLDLRPPDTAEPGVGDAGQIREAYEQVCFVTRRFLDAYLKADQEALDLLQLGDEAPDAHPAAAGERRSRSVTWQYRKAAPPASPGPAAPAGVDEVEKAARSPHE